jgi:hypothetical protein
MLGEAIHGLDGVERRPRRRAERVTAGVADRPQREGEAMLVAGRQRIAAHDR